MSTHLFAQDKQEDIVAVWDAGEAKVEIYKKDERYIGNPINSEGNRNQQIEVLNLEYKEGKWIGKLYSRKGNRLLDVVCEVKEKKLHLEVSTRFATRILEWKQVK
nr:hypothetical protein [Mariniflexile sp. KMM 9835]MDQ8212272.1 hypothetical protein [Mariniflexile sp. KMM 9835]